MRTAEQQEQIDVFLRDLFEERITFNKQIGLAVERLDPGPVCLGFQMNDDLVGHFLYGRLHGGVISAAIDAAGGLATLKSIIDFHRHESLEKVMSRFKDVSTIDLRVDYLRPGLGKAFTVEAEVVRLGKRVAFTKMLVKNEQNKEIAMGSGTYTAS